MKDQAGSKSISELTEEDIIKGERIMVSDDPLALVEYGFLKIKTKTGEIMQFVLNRGQIYLLTIIRRLRKAQIPVRIRLLKSRQIGFSTEIESILYALTSQQEGRNALILADEGDKSENLFSMSELYQESLEKDYPHLAPERQRSNRKELSFKNTHSRIIVDTAENPEAARSFTYQYVHLSECSRFRDLRTLMTGLNQSVPDFWDSLIIEETTANGFDAFQEEWENTTTITDKNINDLERIAKQGWIGIFIPWFWHDEYSRELDGGLYPTDKIRFNENLNMNWFIESEKELVHEFGVSQKQLNWRRWAIVNKCNASIQEFMQEYPATPDEAFLVSGIQFFDTFGLKVQEEKQHKPLAIGNIYKEHFKHIFREEMAGKVKVYEWPDPNEQYIMTADASEGRGLDEGSILVGNARTNRTAAVVNGQYAPDVLAGIAVPLGYYYNTALAVPENKHYGWAMIRFMYDHYTNFYHFKKPNKQNPIDSIGFNTNGATREAILTAADDSIKMNNCHIVSAEVLKQCRNFIINTDTKKAEGANGKQDGLVICWAIFSYIRMIHKFTDHRPRDQYMESIALEDFRNQEMARFGYG